MPNEDLQELGSYPSVEPTKETLSDDPDRLAAEIITRSLKLCQHFKRSDFVLSGNTEVPESSDGCKIAFRIDVTLGVPK